MVMSLKNRFKLYIINKLVIGLNTLDNYRKNYYLNIVRNRKNVQIHSNFYSDGLNTISIRGECALLRIDRDVRCRKYSNILVYGGATLIIHENVFINNYCSINCLDYIEIGANTMLGEGVKVYDHNHAYEESISLIIKRDEYTTAKTTIGRDCWIGSNVTILKGVTIGDNVIVGANCLVYKSIPSNSIVKHSEMQIVNNVQPDSSFLT
jgi:acetyltransferase-like isoleucine patch superfamily enzyme